MIISAFKSQFYTFMMHVIMFRVQLMNYMPLMPNSQYALLILCNSEM